MPHLYVGGPNCSEWIINAGPQTNVRYWAWVRALAYLDIPLNYVDTHLACNNIMNAALE